MQSFPATRLHALERLAEFLPRAAADYARERNYDLGPRARRNVSLLSPYVRHRILTEQEVVAEVLARHGLAAAEKFVDEVCWRTYWRGWLQQHPAVFSDYVAALARLRAELDDNRDLRRRIETAVAGQTGVACFDAWVGELASTGYLHNHARMWFASIWCFTLGLPWELGAAFFYRHLLDGDIASNTLSWRWVAGRQTVGKTYLATSENIARFTDGRFAVTPGLAGEATAVDTGSEIPVFQVPLSPLPTVAPSGRCLLIVTSDDLNPESWPVTPTDVAGIIFVDPQDVYGWQSDAVLGFKRAAIDDAIRRASSHFACPVRRLSDGGGESASDPGLYAWWRGLAAERVIAIEAGIGPGQDDVAAVCVALSDRKCPPELIVLRRSWDDLFWPLATRGFFTFKKEIPAALRELGLLPADGAANQDESSRKAR